jgi:hypothetical protein
VTFDQSNYPYGLGGLQNGGYRASLAQAQSGAAQQSSSADLGASSSYANAYGTIHATKPPAIESAGIRAGEIIGFRAWRLRGDLLQSMFIENYPWRPGAVEHAPVLADTWGAGLHAFKTLKMAKQQYCYAYPGEPIFYGEVALWGDVIEHETGYRAEYASIVSLICYRTEIFDHADRFFGFWKNRTLKRVRSRYGLPRSPSISSKEP